MAKQHIVTGKIYMKSGSVIPFAALSTTDNESAFKWRSDWVDNNHRIISATTHFISYKNIGKISFISFPNVDAIVVDKRINVNALTLWLSGAKE